MPTDPAYPDVPTDQLRDGGWELVDESVETVFQLPTARVEGATKVYDAAETRAAVRDAIGLNHQWRFFFATALSFTPPLAPGIGPAMILPTVRSEAQSAFADELADRGFESIERGRREQVRVDSGDRARLRTYSAELDLEPVDATLSITGWVGVWHSGGFRIAAGAYPDRSLATLLNVENPPEPLRRTPSDYRTELLDLIRAVA
ncbi:hypothetical protein [Haloarcula sp. Atlit-7R]|uniref:hypothetical protein n=1 Tax=Haloarcula sp. Atlit-7R TaxID=2282125 RepID=UPI000EF13FD9|nr:hypothetical protein [Haloarcula sp. Atlit-7R]RLN01444.1 hypothetical protein D3D01_01085 [Haloarcula sp. Atlit-7R]